MKKIIVILLVAFAFFMSNAESKTQPPPCPPPSFIIVQPLPHPLCPSLSANLCVTCDPMSSHTELTIMSLNGVCDLELLPSYLDFAQAVILPNTLNYCALGWIPCGQGYLTTVIRTPLCFRQDPENLGDVHSCNNSYCVEVYEICIDTQTGLPVPTLISSYIDGTLLCAPIVWHPLLTPGTCFRLNLNCP